MRTNEPTKANDRGALYGIISLISAVLTAGSVAMIGFTSFTSFNPPDFLRILTMAPLPVVLVLAVGFGVAGVKSISGKAWGIAGLVLAALAVVAFVGMIATGE